MTGAAYLILDSPGVGPIVKPSRDQVCGVKHQFQGMSVSLPVGSTFDPLKAQYWFDPLITQMHDKADRLAVYAAHRAAGDTHINISLDLGGLSTLPPVLMIAKEAIVEGHLIGVILCCMGDGHGHPNSDPGALGFEWLLQNFSAIYASTKAVTVGDHNLADHVIFVPGYDGVVPDWQPPSAVDRMMLMMRAHVDAGRSGYVGLELSAGYAKWGTDDGIERNNWITPAGKAIDVILQEGPIDMGPPIPVPPPPFPVPAQWTQVYQIAGRMVRPFTPVPGQWDDLNPPYYLYDGTPRGPFFYDFWEYDTYMWTLPWRHAGSPYPLSKVQAHRKALYDCGCQFVG